MNHRSASYSTLTDSPSALMEALLLRLNGALLEVHTISAKVHCCLPLRWRRCSIRWVTLYSKLNHESSMLDSIGAITSPWDAPRLHS